MVTLITKEVTSECRSLYSVSVIFVQIKPTNISSTDFSSNSRNKILRKSFQRWLNFFHAEGRKDEPIEMTDLIVAVCRGFRLSLYEMQYYINPRFSLIEIKSILCLL
jgi:hypothetical protein